MITNQKISEGLSLLAAIDPVSQAAGTANTAWVPVANMHQLMAIVDAGAFGASATVDAKIQQATDGAGTGAKDLGKAITQLVAAGGNNRQALINFRSQDLDTNNGFAFVRLSVTVGVAATQIAAALVGAPRYEDAAAFNPASVAQVV